MQRVNVRARFLAFDKRWNERMLVMPSCYQIRKGGIRPTLVCSVAEGDSGDKYATGEINDLAPKPDTSATREPLERGETGSETSSSEGNDIHKVPDKDPSQRSPRDGILKLFWNYIVQLLPGRFPTKKILGIQLWKLSVFFIMFTLSVIPTILGKSKVAGILNKRVRPHEVVYSDFLRLVESKNIESCRFERGTDRILFKLKEASYGPKHATNQISRTSIMASDVSNAGNQENKVLYKFYTRHIPDAHLISHLRDANVEFGILRTSLRSQISRILTTALAVWLPLLPMFIMMRRLIGRSGDMKGKRNSKEKGKGVPIVKFNDVAGVDIAKKELQEVVECLKRPGNFAKLGARLPSGVLLSGPPGTGKTLLAKAVAGEAGVPFLAVSASEFVELYVGRGAARVRELFSEARKKSPCVVFIDELDALGGSRGASMNEERDQTLNQLLTELDGFDDRSGVLLLAATNRPEILDAALLRPGRLSRKITVDLPNEVARASILYVHLAKINLNCKDLTRMEISQNIAKLTKGLNGADLANICNEAAFLAMRRDAEYVDVSDLIQSVKRQRFGVSDNTFRIPFVQKWLKKSNVRTNDSPFTAFYS